MWHYPLHSTRDHKQSRIWSEIRYLKRRNHHVQVDENGETPFLPEKEFKEENHESHQKGKARTN